MMISRLEFKLEDFDIATSSGTSKGNQPKYTNGDIWIKLNSLGYEDEAEVISSKLLECSNIDNYVRYNYCLLDKKEGCYSENFLKPGDTIKYFGRILGLYGITQRSLDGMKGTRERFDTVVSKIRDYTKLDVTEYLSNILALDCVTLNEDRHIFNLAIIYNEHEKVFKECPIYDNGLGFLSDVETYPLYTSYSIHKRKVKSKPFNTTFKKQLEVCSPTITFKRSEVEKLLLDIENKRISQTIKDAIRNYPQLFV